MVRTGGGSAIFKGFLLQPIFSFLTLYIVVARGGDFGLVYVSFPFFFPLPVIKQHARRDRKSVV